MDKFELVAPEYDITGQNDMRDLYSGPFGDNYDALHDNIDK